MKQFVTMPLKEKNRRIHIECSKILSSHHLATLFQPKVRRSYEPGNASPARDLKKTTMIAKLGESILSNICFPKV